jgi:hypothetical protein
MVIKLTNPVFGDIQGPKLPKNCTFWVFPKTRSPKPWKTACGRWLGVLFNGYSGVLKLHSNAFAFRCTIAHHFYSRHSKRAILQSNGSRAKGVSRKTHCGRWGQAAVYQMCALLFNMIIFIFHFNHNALIMNINANAFTELHHNGI